MSTDDAQQIRQWAAELGWTWPADAPTPGGVYAAIGSRLGVGSEYVRAVFGGRETMPKAWPERWRKGPESERSKSPGAQVPEIPGGA